VAIITPILLDKSAYGAYFLFGGLALFTVIVLAITMPETRGQSLENIQLAFQRPRPTLRALEWFRSLRASASKTRRQAGPTEATADSEGTGTAVELEPMDVRAAPMMR
jgi:hypothetical protein